MISAGVLHRLPSERATEPFALLRVLPRRRFIARYAGLRLFFLKPDSASSAKGPSRGTKPSIGTLGPPAVICVLSEVGS